MTFPCGRLTATSSNTVALRNVLASSVIVVSLYFVEN